MNALLARFVVALAPVVFRVLIRIVRGLHDKNVLERLVVLAQERIKNLDKAPTLAGHEKHELAVKGLKSDLKRLGLEAGDSLINLAIELAVSTVKVEAARRLQE